MHFVVIFLILLVFSKSKSSSITFQTTTGRVVFASERIEMIGGPFRISFKFRTIARSAILLALISNSIYHSNYKSIELINGRIK